MISTIIQALFIKIQHSMSVQEKKRQKVYVSFNAEAKPKNISKIIVVSLWPPSSSDFNPFHYAIRGVLENNKCNFSSKYWFA